MLRTLPSGLIRIYACLGESRPLSDPQSSSLLCEFFRDMNPILKDLMNIIISLYLLKNRSHAAEANQSKLPALPPRILKTVGIISATWENQSWPVLYKRPACRLFRVTKDCFSFFHSKIGEDAIGGGLPQSERVMLATAIGNICPPLLSCHHFASNVQP